MEVLREASLAQTPIQKHEIKMRRGQIEILVDILSLASALSGSKGVTKTHLVYKSGLNFRRFEKYLDLLVKRRLIELIDNKEKTEASTPWIYRTTANGERTRLILLEAESLILGSDDF